MKIKFFSTLVEFKAALKQALRKSVPARHPEFYYHSEQHQFELAREQYRLSQDWRRVS